MKENLTDKIVDACFEVHRAMGPGLSEAIYHECLLKELTNKNLPFESQKRIPVYYKGEILSRYCVLDLVVGDEVVVEVKSVSELASVHKAQLLTYLKLGGYRTGYLINFNVALMKHGIKRMRHGFD
jgi:GxxExxY protein